MTNPSKYDSIESIEIKRVIYGYKEERKSISSLSGIAKGRKVGFGNERDYTKKIVSKKIAKEELKDE